MRPTAQSASVVMLHMTFQDIESIIEAPLPNSARTQPLFWDNLRQPRRASTAWYKASWRTTDVDTRAETLTFHPLLLEPLTN